MRLTNRSALVEFAGLSRRDAKECNHTRVRTIGRQNWLLAVRRRNASGRAAATSYTLIESCKQADLDVLAHLADVLVRVATHPASKIDDLLPMNWAKNFAPTTTA
jgi:IS66 C-terminal element